MRNIITIALIVLNTGFLLAQNWKDSLYAGQNAFQNRQFKEALRLFQSAQKYAPKGVNIQELINQSAYRGKDYEKAANGYAKALKNAKTNAEKSTSNYNLGNAQFKNKNIDEAIESYKNALRANPNNDQARYNLTYALNQKNKNKNNKNNKDNKQNKQNKEKNKQQQNKGNSKQNQPKNNKNKQQQQPRPNQLDEKQADRLLDALAKSDKEAQKKLNKKKDTAKAVILNKKNW